MKERWDLVDSNRDPLGITHFRGDSLPKGSYHTVIEVFTFDPKGNLLLSQRHPEKSYPLLWEGTGGSVLAGETSRAGAVRELREELGLSVLPEQLELIETVRRVTHFLDIYRYKSETVIKLEALSLQPDEVVAVRLVQWEEMKLMDGIVPPVRERLLCHAHLLHSTL